ALIDGEETDIYKCDYLLMGINVPQGNHEIVFRYQPQSVLVGMIGSISGIAIWIILMLVVTWIHRKGKLTLVPSAE
ncbi:MAG: YfhO family protein, partial [bacterium]|nr:YfhO family protein [bacterium]